MPSRAKSYVHVGSFFAGSICGLGGFGVGFCFSKELLRSTGIFILNSNLRLFDLHGFILSDLPLVLWCFHFYIELYSWDVTVAHSHHDIHPWMCIGVCNIHGYRVHTPHTCRVETHSERLHTAYTSDMQKEVTRWWHRPRIVDNTLYTENNLHSHFLPPPSQHTSPLHEKIQL